MDQLKGYASQFTGGNNQNQQTSSQGSQGQFSEGQQQSSGGGGFLGSFGNKMNEAAGGGKASEKNEDYLDKGAYTRSARNVVYVTLGRGIKMGVLTVVFIGIDFVQEKFMGQGKQDNESAVEQAKDEQISDFSKYI